jgi:hypothetical protein
LTANRLKPVLALAVSVDPAARDAFFASLSDESRRELLEVIQVIGDFFPQR